MALQRSSESGKFRSALHQLGQHIKRKTGFHPGLRYQSFSSVSSVRMHKNAMVDVRLGLVRCPSLSQIHGIVAANRLGDCSRCHVSRCHISLQDSC